MRRGRRGGIWLGPGPSGSGARVPSTDTGGGGSPALNPQVAMRLAVLGGIAIALLTVLLLRLWFLQVIGSEAYASQADSNRLRSVVLDAPRGDIVDRDGEVLATSQLVQNLVAQPLELRGQRRERVVRRLADKLDLPAGEVRAKLEAGDATPYRSVVIEEDVPQQVQLYIAERRHQFPGVSLRQSYKRIYPNGAVAAHVLGYTGAISAKAEDDYLRRGYGPDERVGVSGVELQYESWLRGKPGERKVEVDATGEPVAQGVVSDVPPRKGNTLQLSIDLDVQQALERSLDERVAIAGLAEGGAGVAMDPRNGEVLALASVPDFDPNVFESGNAKRIAATTGAPNLPMFDRALSGTYPPASTFKPITAAAAIDYGILDPEALVFAGSDFEVFGQTFDNFDGTINGEINLRQALEVSSDTYFYPFGVEFFRDQGTPLQDWTRRFGLGKPTRIDLPGEAPGLVPDPNWKRRYFAGSEYSELARQWLGGDTIQLTIGQGYMRATAVQMAVAYGAIANGGTVRTPTVGKRVLDATGVEGRQLAALAAGKPSHQLEIDESTMGTLREGLRRAANESLGTSVTIFGGLPEGDEAAGKTGTAEDPPGGDHSWYIGYAPHDDPRIVVSTVIERGGPGYYSAAPVVCATIAADLSFDPELCGTPSAPVAE